VKFSRYVKNPNPEEMADRGYIIVKTEMPRQELFAGVETFIGSERFRTLR
jgi:hypothetical protein